MSGPTVALLVTAMTTQSGDHCSAGLRRQEDYSVQVTERYATANRGSLISKVNGTSSINFNFATAWFPLAGSAGGDGLVVRIVECSPDHHPCPNATHPEWTNAGALAIIRAKLPADGALTVQHVDLSEVQWAGATPPPRSTQAKWGAADPRIAYRPATGTYYLAWDNCTANCYPQRKTLLSTTQNPLDRDGWTLHGAVFPLQYSSGASFLFRDPPARLPHLAFVANSNTAAQIMLTESTDGLTWNLPRNRSREVFMAGRPGCWDSAGVAAGPQPEKLSTGDYLYIYNIDTGFPYHPNPLGRCAVGWAILDRDDPSVIVARSTDALLIAEAPWETCPEGKGYACQEPMVVFSTGLKPLGNDEFYVLYGAGDTDVGISRIRVDSKALRRSASNERASSSGVQAVIHNA